MGVNISTNKKFKDGSTDSPKNNSTANDVKRISVSARIQPLKLDTNPNFRYSSWSASSQYSDTSSNATSPSPPSKLALLAKQFEEHDRFREKFEESSSPKSQSPKAFISQSPKFSNQSPRFSTQSPPHSPQTIQSQSPQYSQSPRVLSPLQHSYQSQSPRLASQSFSQSPRQSSQSQTNSPRQISQSNSPRQISQSPILLSQSPRQSSQSFFPNLNNSPTNISSQLTKEKRRAASVFVTNGNNGKVNNEQVNLSPKNIVTPNNFNFKNTNNSNIINSNNIKPEFEQYLKENNDLCSIVNFKWMHTPASVVYISGTFSNWELIPLLYSKKFNLFHCKIQILRGVHHFRFNVDGIERLDPLFEIVKGNDGQNANCAFLPFTPSSPSKISPSSQEGIYNLSNTIKKYQGTPAVSAQDYQLSVALTQRSPKKDQHPDSSTTNLSNSNSINSYKRGNISINVEKSPRNTHFPPIQNVYNNDHEFKPRSRSKTQTPAYLLANQSTLVSPSTNQNCTSPNNYSQYYINSPQESQRSMIASPQNQHVSNIVKSHTGRPRSKTQFSSTNTPYKISQNIQSPSSVQKYDIFTIRKEEIVHSHSVDSELDSGNWGQEEKVFTKEMQVPSLPPHISQSVFNIPPLRMKVNGSSLYPEDAIDTPFHVCGHHVYFSSKHTSIYQMGVSTRYQGKWTSIEFYTSKTY